MKKLNVVFIIIFIKVSVLGQSSWEELIQDEKSTKSEIIQSFESEFPDIKNEYYKAMKMAAENNEDFFRSKKYAKFKPYINFERYKYRVLDKLDDIDCLSDYYNSFNIYANYNYEKLKEKKQLNLKSATDTWKPIGPDGYIFTQGTGFGGGGRIDRLRFHPTDTATMYACSPGGGLWKTTDDGKNWIPLSDFTGVTAVSDVLIHPEDPDIIYLATGESDTWWMNGSVGILKSVDGGQNWDKAGLELPISQHVRIQRLLMHPTQPDSLYAGTSIGIYASGDGGDNWEKVYSNLDVWNMEFKPGNPAIIYVGCAQGFYKSEDAGKSFRKVYSGVPPSDVDMVNIAVSPSSPDIVYAMFRGKMMQIVF